MNPKAIKAEEMFGETNKASGEWVDGVFAAMWSKFNDRGRKDMQVGGGALDRQAPSGASCPSRLGQRGSGPTWRDPSAPTRTHSASLMLYARRSIPLPGVQDRLSPLFCASSHPLLWQITGRGY